MSLGMAVQVFALAEPNFVHAQSYILLFGTLFYVLMFAIGVGPVPLALLPEIFPNRIRAKAMALSMGVHWMTNSLVGLICLPILNEFGAPVLYGFFAFVSLLGVVFVKKCIVETKGRSLEEIEALMFSDF